MKSGYGRENRKNELSEEIQSHIRMDVEARVQAGQTPEEARQAALREFGNIALIEDVTHSFWGWVRLERLLQDIRYVLRSFRRNRGFILMVVGTLAVGIGATSGMFTVVNTVLLRSLPYRNPNQLVDIRESGKRGVVAYGSPYQDIQEWRDRSEECIHPPRHPDHDRSTHSLHIM